MPPVALLAVALLLPPKSPWVTQDAIHYCHNQHPTGSTSQLHRCVEEERGLMRQINRLPQHRKEVAAQCYLQWKHRGYAQVLACSQLPQAGDINLVQQDQDDSSTQAL